MSERDLFIAALKITDPTERAAWLDRECGGDAGLRQRIDKLLQAFDKAGSVLENPFVAAPTTVTIDRPLTEGAGVAIGPYKLVELIGEGGMGAVWMAQQSQPVKRVVALKLIKAGMGSAQIVARFEAERQALALMDHPNIARVLDAGTTPSGRPYFVMDLVKGVPITKYCDEHHLTPRQRLELFIPICQAIQHAHQKGIIHRDLKPSNVLVAPYDGHPVPKVIDFGVAKAAGQQLTDHTLVTGFGAVVGTPEYMSPEQAEFNNQDIDTRSDIYALGVLLYELLTGTPPFSRKELEHVGMMEILRVIREQEPSKPSTKLSSAAGLPALAANRGIEPKQLTAQVRGELDWIVMKALEKDRGRRYETANAFARDIQRYLSDETVEACPPNAGYRLKKFVRRNRVAITTATLVVAALVLGTIVSTWQAFRAEAALGEAQAQRQLADENFQKARKAVDEYFTLVSESKLLDVPGMQPLRKELLEAALRYYQAMRNERADDPTVLADLVVAQLHVANVYHELDRNDDALAAVELAVPLAERLRRDYPHSTEQHRRLAGYWKVDRAASAISEMPKNATAAERTLIKFLQLWETLARENPTVEAFQNDIAEINNLLAALEAGRARAGERAAFPRAIAYARKAIAIWEQLSQAHSDIPRHRENLARAYAELAAEFERAGQKDQAKEASARATALQEKLITQFSSVPMYRVLDARRLTTLASTLADGQPQESERVYQQALQAWQKLAADFPAAHEYTVEFARAQIKYAAALAGPLNRANDAMRVFQEGNEKLKKLVAEHPDEPKYRKELALAPGELASRFRESKDHLLDAETLHLQSLAIFSELAQQFPKEPSYVERTGYLYRYLGWIARDTGRPAEAIDYFEKGVDAFQKLAQADIPQRNGFYRENEANTLKELALVLVAGGRLPEAEDAYRRAISAREPLEKASPEQRLAQANIYHELANLLMPEQRLHEAEEAYRQAVKLKQALATEFPENSEYRYHLAHSYLGLTLILTALNRAPDAVQATSEADRLLKALAADTSAPAMMQENVGHTLWQLADCWTRLNRWDNAMQAVQRALESFQQLAADHPERPYYRQEQAFSHRKLADLSAHDGRTDDVERHLHIALTGYRQLVIDSPDSVYYRQEVFHVACALGNLMLRVGRASEAAAEFAEAIKDSSAAIKQKPEVSQAYRSLAGALRAQKMLPEAIATLREAIDFDPKDYLSYFILGNTLLLQENWPEAIEAYKKALELDPNYAPARAGLAQVERSKAIDYAATGRSSDALRSLQDLLDKSDRSGGNSFADSAMIASCVQHFRRMQDLAACRAAIAALEMTDPKDAGSLYNTARCRALTAAAQAQAKSPEAAGLAKEDADQAMAWLKKAVSAGFVNVARFQQDTDLDFLREREDFRKLMTEAEARYSFFLGNSLKAKGDLDGADRAYREAVRLDGDHHGAAMDALAELLLSRGHKKEAIATYQSIVALDPENASAHLGLGNALKANGDMDKALAAYRAAAEAHEKKNPADAMGLYNAACYRARTAEAQAKTSGPDAAGLAKEDADRAMDWLTKAVAIGFADAKLLHEDADVESLRQRNDFQKLVAKLDALLQARSFILLSQWDKAAAEYAKVDLLTQPLRDDAFANACLFLIRGDNDGYDRFCQAMIRHAGQTEDPVEAFVLARTCAMVRKCPVDPARSVEWANKALASAQHGWFFHALGLAQYRAGQFDNALQSFSKANVNTWIYRGLNWFGLALVHHRLGHPDEARRCLDNGIKWLEQNGSSESGRPVKIHALDWLEVQVLRREAEELLNIKRSP